MRQLPKSEAGAGSGVCLNVGSERAGYEVGRDDAEDEHRAGQQVLLRAECVGAMRAVLTVRSDDDNL